MTLYYVTLYDMSYKGATDITRGAGSKIKTITVWIGMRPQE